MRRKGQATGKAAPEEPPGLHEVASKLNEILDRSNAIEEQLRTLEILKETKAKTSKSFLPSLTPSPKKPRLLQKKPEHSPK